jgi:hypothetical protein
MNKALLLGLIFLGLIGCYVGFTHWRVAINPGPIVTECESQEAARNLAKKTIAATGGQIVATAGTPSMEPLIIGEAILIIAKCDYEDLAAGDVVQVNMKLGRFTDFTHRLFSKDGGGWTISGDNNSHYDKARVTPANLMGKCTHIFTSPEGRAKKNAN